MLGPLNEAGRDKISGFRSHPSRIHTERRTRVSRGALYGACIHISRVSCEMVIFIWRHGIGIARARQGPTFLLKEKIAWYNSRHLDE